MKKPEILAPAGSMEKLKFALRFGADAVYLGGSDFSLRAQGKNFGQAELTEAVHYVHEQGKKVYVTVNIYPHEDDLTGLADYLRFLESVGVDAAIVSDLGIFTLARQVAPKLPLHVSTQANTLNSAAVNAWAAMGAERVVLGREVSLEELRDITLKVNLAMHSAGRVPKITGHSFNASDFARTSSSSSFSFPSKISNAIWFAESSSAAAIPLIPVPTTSTLLP